MTLWSIQYLRGVAAVLVVLFHLSEIFVPSLRPLTWVGAIGVDIFFVISGFIMWHVAQVKEPRPSSFLLHRAIRIAPLYWLMTFALFGCATLKPNLFPLDRPTPSHLFQSMLFIPHVFNGRAMPVLSQGWTLVYEAFFYLVFAVSLLVPIAQRMWAIVGVLVMLVVGGMIVSPDAIAARTYTSPLLLEFAAGIWLAAAYRHSGLRPRSIALIVLVVAMFGTVVALAGSQSEALRLLLGGTLATFIVAFAVRLEQVRGIVRSRVLVELGNASYSIYLAHYLIAVLVSVVVQKTGMNPRGPAPYFLSVFITILGGVLIYQFIERPLLAAMRHVLNHRSKSTQRTMTEAEPS